MNKLSIKEISKKYDLELDRVINQIKKSKAKLVLLQFAEGLKPYATTLVDYLDEKFKGKVEFLIWFESCFGACDIPIGLENLKPKIDLIIQFGHNEKMPVY
jgi:2-(3-amino-3-carboxypropyl)histidine synthase